VGGGGGVGDGGRTTVSEWSEHLHVAGFPTVKFIHTNIQCRWSISIYVSVKNSVALGSVS
jgi:hypothetical protein